MDGAEFKRLNWQDQNAALRPHLHWVLARITEPRPTTYVAWAISERTGLDEKVLGRLLIRRFARHGYATQDGEEAHAYGRTFKRFMWPPRKEESGT